MRKATVSRLPMTRQTGSPRSLTRSNRLSALPTTRPGSYAASPTRQATSPNTAITPKARSSHNKDRGEREWQYRYHPENGQISQVTREDGSTIDFAYNEKEQLIRETYHPAPADQIKADQVKQATATPSGHETPANETLTTEYTYDDEGNLCQAKNAHSTIGLAYNRLGQLETQNNDGQIIECAYNNGKLVSLRYLDQAITYQRDRQGALQAIQVNDEEAFIQQQYNSQQQLTERQYPNQQGETFRYDKTWQLTQIQTAQQDIPYQTDKTGQIIQKGDTRYRYDASSRLVQSGGRHFQYDQNGNLTHQWTEDSDTQPDAAQEPQKTFANQYDPANNQLQETETHTFNYDARGNLQSKTHKASGQAVHYSWNLRDQLIRVHGHSYQEQTQNTAEIDLRFRYDAVGRRQEKWDAITQTKRQYLYDQLDIVAIATYEKGQERRITTLVHDDTIDTPLRIQNQHGTFHYHRDHQGSIIALTDEQGEVVERFEYDNDYGAITHHEKSTETDNPYVYTGREYDADDLYYYRARYYDPTIKRFLGEDPIGFLAGDANFYRYVSNHPTNAVDPSGLGICFGLCIAAGLLLVRVAIAAAPVIIRNAPKIIKSTKELIKKGAKEVKEELKDEGKEIAATTVAGIVGVIVFGGGDIKCGELSMHSEKQKKDAKKDTPEEMNSDHIPNTKSMIKEAKEDKKFKSMRTKGGVSKKERQRCILADIESQAITIGIPQVLHAVGRTYKKKGGVVAKDGDSLSLKKKDDIEWYERILGDDREKLTKKEKEAVDKIDKDCKDELKKGLEKMKEKKSPEDFMREIIDREPSCRKGQKGSKKSSGGKK